MTVSHQRKNIHFLIQGRSYDGRIPVSESENLRVSGHQDGPHPRGSEFIALDEQLVTIRWYGL